jgi:hypothetical protein
LHQSDPNNQLAAGMETNEACLQCHTAMRNKVEQHTHHAASSSGSLCYNCHMPRTVYGLLKAIRSHQIDNPSVRKTVATGRPNACNLCHLDRSLGWTSKYLSEWYGQRPFALTDEQEKLSAAILWVTEGDAGQRALAAYSMGWQAARQVSGERWQAPFLAVLLDDPYSAVRYVAYRSLKSLPGESKQVSYDFIGPEAERQKAAREVLARWKNAGREQLDRTGAEILIAPTGALDEEKLGHLLQRRNNRSMDLQE